MSGPRSPCSHGAWGALHREDLEIPRALVDGLERCSVWGRRLEGMWRDR
jgi:hypothetical protein